MEDLTLRQNEVKRLISEYREALELNGAKNECEALTNEFRAKLEGKGLPLYGEEVLACLNLLEDLLDFTDEAVSVEQVQVKLAMHALGLVQTLTDRWTARDGHFFVQ